MNLNVNQKQTVIAKKELYKQIGKFLGMVPHIWGMATESFYIELGHELCCAPETARGYATKGISAEFNFTQLSEALENVLHTFVNDPQVDPETKETAKRNHELSGKPLLEFISTLYLSAEMLGIAEPLQSNENKMMVTINLFMYGRWPEHSGGLSAEETEWLRQCLNHFPPKCFNTSKIKTDERAISQFMEDKD